MNREVYEKFKEELGFKPAPGTKAPGPMVSVKVSGNIAYVSGHVAFSSGELQYKGRIGADVSIEDGKKSAALSVINCLDSLDSVVGLDNIDTILKVTGYLSCAEDVTEHPSIMNAASDVLFGVFGDDGRHARAALGIHTLPLGASTEVELIVQLKS
ncbi:RidA family protein [Paenibacillus eucommiae]|uniref:Enamine deaminase RidA (YjgF/YER057c/UK114 family) n=1 Tax=Paenibacillus eucommiae TaxID=1355755 RepID=A0ABS4IV67_9BACL|nr:RidA family protein [Paenibacillus eucommiae]MBP1990731.1 enamine deaminase RidA (YjgF/YER057c/UK114 family) [Paenibacillus eucommiae]